MYKLKKEKKMVKVLKLEPYMRLHARGFRQESHLETCSPVFNREGWYCIRSDQRRELYLGLK